MERESPVRLGTNRGCFTVCACVCACEHKRERRQTAREKPMGECNAQKACCFLTLFNGARSACSLLVQYVLCVCVRTVGGRVEPCQTSLSLTLLRNLAFGHPMAQCSLLP